VGRYKRSGSESEPKDIMSRIVLHAYCLKPPAGYQPAAPHSSEMPVAATLATNALRFFTLRRVPLVLACYRSAGW
jgi:hypothetical protein